MQKDSMNRNENKIKQWFNRTFKLNVKPVNKLPNPSFTLPRSVKEVETNCYINQQALTLKALTFHQKHSGPNEAPKFIGLLQSEYHIYPVKNDNISISDQQDMLIIFEPILLYCYVQSTAQDVVFIWQKDSVEIHPNDRIDILCQDTATQLRINCPNISDDGNYDCIAVNPEGKCSTHTRIFIELPKEAKISVKSMPERIQLNDIENSQSQDIDLVESQDSVIPVEKPRKLHSIVTHHGPLERLGLRRTVCYSKSFINPKRNDMIFKCNNFPSKFNSFSACENILLSNEKHIGSRRYLEDTKGWKYSSFRYLRSYDLNQTHELIQAFENTKQFSDITNNGLSAQKLLSIKNYINSRHPYPIKSMNNSNPKVDHNNSPNRDESLSSKKELKELNTGKRRHQSSILLPITNTDLSQYQYSYYQEQQDENSVNHRKCNVRKRRSYETDSFCSTKSGNPWKLLPKTNSSQPRKQGPNQIQRTDSIAMSKSSTTSNLKSLNDIIFSSNLINIGHRSGTGSSSISDINQYSGYQSSQRSWSDIDLNPLSNTKLIEVRYLNEPNKENQKDSISSVVQEIVMQYVEASKGLQASVFENEDYDYRFTDKEVIKTSEQKKITDSAVELSNEERGNCERKEDYSLDNKPEVVSIPRLSFTLNGDEKSNESINHVSKSLNLSDCEESENQRVLDCSKISPYALTTNEKPVDTSSSPIYHGSSVDKKICAKQNDSPHNNNNAYSCGNGYYSSLENFRKNPEANSTISTEQRPPEPVRKRPNISAILVDKRLFTASRYNKNNITSVSLSNIKSVSPTEPVSKAFVYDAAELVSETVEREACHQREHGKEKLKRSGAIRKYSREQRKLTDRENNTLSIGKNDKIYKNDSITSLNSTASAADTSISPKISSEIAKTSNHKDAELDKAIVYPDIHELNHSHQSKIRELIQKFQTPSRTTCISPSKQVINRIPRFKKQLEDVKNDDNNNLTKTNESVDSMFYSTIGVGNIITKDILNNSRNTTSVRSKTSSSSSSSPPPPLQCLMSATKITPADHNSSVLLPTANNIQRDNQHEHCEIHSVMRTVTETDSLSVTSNHQHTDRQNGQIKRSYESVCQHVSSKSNMNNTDDSNSFIPSLKKYSAYSREEVKQSQCKIVKKEAYKNQRGSIAESNDSTTITLVSKHSSSRQSVVSQNVSLHNATSNQINSKLCTEAKTAVKLDICSSVEASNKPYVKCLSEEVSFTCKEDENERIEYPLKISTIKNINPCDHYEEIGVLGYGTYGHVMKCKEKSTGCIFAAKKFKILRLKRHKGELMEVAILRAIGKHPQIAHLHAAYEYNIYCTIVTEYVSGGALYNRIEKEGSLDEAITVSIVRQVLLGLKHLQDCSVIHRDLKPENLMMVQSSGYRLKIIDFGLAIFYTGSQCPPIPAGTLTYIAPETQNCDPQTYTTDLWSLAVIAYEILAGITPFEIPQEGCRDRTLTNHEISLNITHCRYDFDDPGIVDVSKEAKDFIKQILVRDPNKRPSVQQCLNHPWMAMREEDRPPVKRTLSLFRHSTRRKPKGYRFKPRTTQKGDPQDPVTVV
ncbi:unnamed protein product [Trichobilharzia szidati]|nr:unnamed protein product [Trichobilharzia szidati]